MMEWTILQRTTRDASIRLVEQSDEYNAIIMYSTEVYKLITLSHCTVQL